MTETYLYRHYNAEGVLLYVGISLTAIGRYQQHKQSGHWANDIASRSRMPKAMPFSAHSGPKIASLKQTI